MDILTELLSEEQLGFFARNGFLQVRSFIDPDVCGQLVDHTWTRFPAHWSRHDPQTWVGNLEDSCHSSDLESRRGHVKFQRGDLIGHPVIERSFGSSARGGELAKALIGHRLSKMRVRGLYTIVPLPPASQISEVSRPHIESHPCMLVALCYLADVEPGGGGLLVWPGSHRAIYPCMGSKLEHVQTADCENVFKEWACLEPVALPGQRGDIVIIHHRLLHAPSLNRTTQIRYGFLCDYQRDDFRELCVQPPGPDMWEDWPAIAVLPSELREAPPDFQLAPQRDLVGGQVTSIALDSEITTKRADADPSYVRKADASALARARRAGDVWLAISDDQRSSSDINLHPCGSDLSASGLVVRVNGAQVKSLCQYDFINRLAVGPGAQTIEIGHLDRPVWLRVLQIRLPFGTTQLLTQKALQPGSEATVNFTVEAACAGPQS